MQRRVRARAVAFVAIVALTILAVAVFTTGQAPSPPPVPSPNGYDDLVKASGAMRGNVFDFPPLDREGLRALVSTNAEALRLLRLGLTRQCVIPIDSAPTYFRLGNMKRLVHLLAEEGRLREMEDRTADAARSYIDAVHFGNEMSRGRFLTYRIIGIECEAIGCNALAKVVPKLPRNEARLALTELEKIESDRVTGAETMRNERSDTLHQLIFRPNPIATARGWWQDRQVMKRLATGHQLMVARVRLLAAELALRSYQSDQRRVPAHLDDLVPGYLSKVPQDPFTGRAMIYRPQGTNWLLYSVGPDGLDDGGTPAGSGWPPKGDLFFDSP